MLKLARAHGLELTFVDAVNKSEPFVKWWMRCVRGDVVRSRCRR
jgi:hypothetical protein